MPSAASVKIDKQINPENALADPSQNLTPLRQAITIIEHKIRNLEKRKSKLESYRELQNAGKELNSDQKTAVAKFNEVTNTLEFARDLCKQFLGIASGSEKEAKKSAKKEAAARYQADLARLREILLVQDALNQMGNDPVREDFLQGRNGAAQLTESDLKLLDDLYPAVTPKHEAGNPVAFTNEVQAAAEHLLAVVDGKPKEVFGGTYSQIKEILGKIHESGYFDQAQIFEGFVEGEIIAEVQEVPLETPALENDVVPEPPADPLPTVTSTIPVIESMTIESRTFTQQIGPVVVDSHQPQPQQQQPPTVDQTMPSVEPLYYQQVAPQTTPVQQQPQQPPRPITEMLGTGSFFFLQESEIDPPEQIPTQTFTNQNFNPHNPHQVPLAPTPHFPTLPNNLPTTNNQVPPLGIGNNGIEETLVKADDCIPQHKEVPSNVNRVPPPRNNNGQPYYSNNFNNRPRHQQNPNRNGTGPRPSKNREN